MGFEATLLKKIMALSLALRRQKWRFFAGK
jgi:hypothetical protein